MITIAAGKLLIELIELAYAANKPVMLHSRHGVGKSEMLAETANVIGIDYIVRDLSLMEPPDLIGMPYRKSGRTYYAPPSFLPVDGKGLIVFEELNRSPEYMQAPCLQLLSNRTLNDYKLPQGWLPCAAVNDASDGYRTKEIDKPLESRFLNVKLLPDIDEWSAWASEQQIHHKIICFVKNCPGVFDDPDANPRAWTYASQILQTWENNKKKNHDILLTALAGILGEKWCLGFIQFYNDTCKPLKPKDIIKDYPVNRTSAIRWIKQGKLDVIAASLENLKRHIQSQSRYDAILCNSSNKSNVKNFISDLPGDLRKQMRDWLAERGFKEIRV